MGWKRDRVVVRGNDISIFIPAEFFSFSFFFFFFFFAVHRVIRVSRRAADRFRSGIGRRRGLARP